MSVRVMKLDPTPRSYADYQHELFNSDAQFCLWFIAEIVAILLHL